ncbi:MAG TPA: DUF1656 domain-containing protein [Patescibacteria group bacterium]|nr:DUF1656 domain-containing protein [Patescibacteria group bacterium]
MQNEVDIGGLYVSPFAVSVLAAGAVFLLLRWGLARSGWLAKLWYPALFEVALFVVVLSVLVSVG